MKFILPVLFLVTSCSSTMVKSVGPKSKYAPKNHQETGVVKYLNAGADWLIEQRKESAYKQMYDACGGEYEIIREGNQTQFQASWSSYDKDYWMIEFRCSSRSPSSLRATEDEI